MLGDAAFPLARAPGLRFEPIGRVLDEVPITIENFQSPTRIWQVLMGYV